MNRFFSLPLNPGRHIRVLALAVLMTAGWGCSQPQIDREYQKFKDLRPLIPRSPAAAQKRIDAKTDFHDLVDSLSDPNPGVAMRAASLLGESGDERATLPLIGLLNHSDPSFRFAASEALIALDASAVMGLIDTLEHADAETISTISDILGKIGDKRAVEPLLDILRQAGSDRAVASAAEALGELGDGKAILPLIKLLEHDHSEIQYASAQSLLKIGKPAIPYTIDGLEHPDEDIRLIMVDMLGRSGDERSVLPLLDLLEAEPSDAVRMSAVQALGRLGDPRSIPVLVALLVRDTSVVRTLASEALARMGDAAVSPLLEILARKDPEVQDRAAEALVTIGTEAVDPLLVRLNGAAPDAAWQIIDALARIKDQKAIGPIAEKLADSDPDPAMKAAEALGSSGGPAAIDPLIRTLKDDRSPARQIAADALVRIGPTTISPLISVLSDQKPETRQLASDALSAIGTPAVDLLAAEMLSGEVRTRNEASRILVSIGPDAVVALGSILSDLDPAGRQSAADALIRIGGQPALNVLVNALSIWRSRQTAAGALDALKWRPSNPEERIHYHIAKGRKDLLKEEWGICRYLLIKKTESAIRRHYLYGIKAMVGRGEDSLLPELIDFLEKQGDREWIHLYLDSGKAELVRAANDWLERHKEEGSADTETAAKDPQTIAEEIPGWGSLDENSISHDSGNGENSANR